MTKKERGAEKERERETDRWRHRREGGKGWEKYTEKGESLIQRRGARNRDRKRKKR